LEATSSGLGGYDRKISLDFSGYLAHHSRTAGTEAPTAHESIKGHARTPAEALETKPSGLAPRVVHHPYTVGAHAAIAAKTPIRTVGG
jgi:hypothetical protein